MDQGALVGCSGTVNDTPRTRSRNMRVLTQIAFSCESCSISYTSLLRLMSTTALRSCSARPSACMVCTLAKKLADAHFQRVQRSARLRVQSMAPSALCDPSSTCGAWPNWNEPCTGLPTRLCTYVGRRVLLPRGTKNASASSWCSNSSAVN